MLLIERNKTNDLFLTLRESSSIASSGTSATTYYLFQFQNDLTREDVFFCPRIISSTTNYDWFQITETGSTSVNLTGGTIHLAPSYYWHYWVYEQSSDRYNLNITGTTGVIIEQGKVLVSGSTCAAQPVQYIAWSGTSRVNSYYNPALYTNDACAENANEPTPIVPDNGLGNMRVGAYGFDVTGLSYEYIDYFIKAPASASTLLNLISTASADGKSLVIIPHQAPHNIDDTFNVPLAKAQIDALCDSILPQLSAAAAQGTLVGWYLGDEFNESATWGGAPVPMSDIDAIGVYCKGKCNITTLLRVKPSFYSAATFSGNVFSYVDFCIAQYANANTSASQFFADEVSFKNNINVELIASLNTIDFHPVGTGATSAMTASEILSYGQTAINTYGISHFQLYKYNAGNFDDPTTKANIHTLQDLAHATQTQLQLGQ